MSIQQLKADEFQRRAFELSDDIFQGKIKSIELTQVQLEFYGVELISVMRTFISFLEQLEGPPHPEDQRMIWTGYADKRGEKYRLKFTQRLETTKKSKSTNS